MGLCPRILTTLCKREGQFDLSFLILFLGPLGNFTVDYLFCPSTTPTHTSARYLLGTVLGSGDTKVDHVSPSTESSGSHRRKHLNGQVQ